MKQEHWINARTCVYNIWYHVVWSTKYRKPILINSIADDCKNMIYQIALENNFMIAQVEIMPDHVHLFISAHPKNAPTEINKKLKGITGKYLLQKYPELRKEFTKHHLWNPSTYYGTAGDVSRDTIEKYISLQKTKAGISNVSDI